MAEANGLWPRPTGRPSSSTCFLAAVRQGHAIERGGGDRVARRRELDADGTEPEQRQLRDDDTGARSEVEEGVVGFRRLAQQRVVRIVFCGGILVFI